MPTLRFKAGDPIVSEGERAETAFLIVSGTLEVSVGAGKKSRIVATLGPGEVFGEMCLIEPGRRSATVKAVTEAACRVISYDEFMASIQEDPASAVQFMRTLVQRLREANQRLASIDPRKGGLRALFGERQQSAPPAEYDLSEPHWWMKL
jgi:CRP-like cAMP-binding protein